MDMGLKDRFNILWQRYFNNAELPITFYYTDEAGHAEEVKPGTVSRCVIGAISAIRQGNSLAFDTQSIGCFGGKRYLGFTDKIRPDFEYFLSCGIPDKVTGERYKKSPELVREAMNSIPRFNAPARYIIFQRWDKLEQSDKPEVIIFFAKPDVLSGLFTLANFDEGGTSGVISPFGSGCSSIVQYPYQERESPHPRSVIGLFDISARPFVTPDTLTFATPLSKFISMVNNIEESFLITNSWRTIQKRLRVD